MLAIPPMPARIERRHIAAPFVMGIKQQERKQTMSKAKTKRATVVATASEPIVVNGIEFTPKMIEDLTKIAEIEASTKKDKKTADNIKSMYKLFIEENESALRENWIRVGNLRIKLEVTRSLKVEVVD
jgi:hypothetical protein